ncbi:MAG: MFS transporter [Acidobacteria bacterium]|nr:MFS transporter [Acidobacteriota bacterium]
MAERRGAIVSTLFLIVFVDLVGFGMVIPIFPLYIESFHPGKFTFGLLAASYSVMQFLFAPALGRLSDRFGRRPVLLVSLLGAVAGYLLLGFAGSLAMLFASRIVAGICGANISTARAVIADVYGPEGRAKGMGIIGAAFGLGFIVGPGLAGVLLRLGPWAPGVAAAATSFVAFLLTWFLLPETLRPGIGERLRHHTFEASRLAHVMARPALALAVGAALLMLFAFSNFEVTFALFMTERLGLHPDKVSWTFLYAGVLAVIVQGFLIGPLSRAFGEARLVAAGTALCALALGALPYLGGLVPVLADLAVLAFGFGIANPSLSAYASRLAAADEIGGVMGIYESAQSLGRILGMFWGPVLFTGLGFAWPYRAGALLMLLGAAAAAYLASRPRPLPAEAG